MQCEDVDSTLSEIERTFAEDPSATLAGTGFWTAVATAKQDALLVEEFAERFGALDRRAYERWAVISLPLYIGTMVALVGTGFGLVLVALAYSTEEPVNGLLLLAGMGVLFITTHSLAHLVVGRLAGIRFTHWFVAGVGRPQPGVKTDYASYLKASPQGRAWMHAAGAITSKIVPFALIPAAVISGVPWWATTALVVVGVSGLITDSLLSVRKGDWKKFKREMAYK